MSFRKVIMPIQKQGTFHWLAKAQLKTKVYFNVEVRTNPLVLAHPKFLRNRDFPNVHSLIKKLVFAEKDFFCEELAKSNQRSSNPELCGRLQDLFS